MSSEFLITLTRISPTEHTFAYTRPDGTGETLTLNTREFLFHDLLHFAVETEAHLAHSFYGNLAASTSYKALAMMNDTAGGEISITERVVGALTGALKHDLDPASFLSLLGQAFLATNEHLPDWLNTDFILRIKERMRRLNGEWNGTPFGQSMNLRFPIA